VKKNLLTRFLKKKVAPKTTPKVAAKKEESEDSSEEVVTKKAVPAKKVVTKKQESDSEESEEEAPKKAPAKKVAKKEESDEEEEVVKTVPQPKVQSQPQSSSTCTELFVRNLAWKTDENSLEQFFSNYGTILSKKVLTDRNTGKPRGLGFVEFSSREEAQAALNDADNLNIDGRVVQVTFSDEKPERTGGNNNNNQGYQGGQSQKSNYQGEKFTIFVGNLSFKSNENSVKKFFSSCGNVVDCRIAKNEEGKMKGFAHVDFDSAEAVESAKKLAGTQLDGREVRVDASTPKQGGGSRGGARGGRGGFRGGRGGANPKKTGSIGVANANAVKTFDDDDE